MKEFKSSLSVNVLLAVALVLNYIRFSFFFVGNSSEKLMKCLFLGNMASRLLFSSLRQVQKLQKSCIHGRSRIGNREVVGFGLNGQYSYQDRVDFPMPAVRFKENTPDIVVSTDIFNTFCLRVRVYPWL
jgi:hypothetical protein